MCLSRDDNKAKGLMVSIFSCVAAEVHLFDRLAGVVVKMDDRPTTSLVAFFRPQHFSSCQLRGNKGRCGPVRKMQLDNERGKPTTRPAII